MQDPQYKGLNLDMKPDELIISPLSHSVLLGAGQLAEILITNGADVNERPLPGKLADALQAAAWTGKDTVVQLLLDNGADINAQGGYCGNALQAAEQEG